MKAEIKETLEALVIKGGNLEAKDLNSGYNPLADHGADMSPLPSAVDPKLS